MATALELFKQANLESILNPAMIGAGIGGLGYGASSFINDEEKDTSTKLKNSLLSALKGAGIGGLAGAGYGAGKEVLSQLSAPKDAVGKLLQNNPNLDASPHGKNHFIEAMAGNAVFLAGQNVIQYQMSTNQAAPLAVGRSTASGCPPSPGTIR